MEWISVEVDLPKNGDHVLTLIEDYFSSKENVLCQKRSYRVFQSQFYRYKGWITPFASSECNVKYWMPIPTAPKFD